MALLLVNKLLSNDEKIYRILGIKEEKSLVIDCIKRTMPYWVDNVSLKAFSEIKEEELLEKAGISLPAIGELSNLQLKTMHFRFGTISSCLAKIVNENERKLMTFKASLDYGVSLQTIRHRLCDYLAFQNIVILAPKVKKNKELSEDQQNFRWALNRYFYDSKKLSLRQTYKFLIRDKYMDSDGKILQNCPKFHQFRYFYYKNRNKSNFIISRLGKGEYKKNFRPLLGDGVRSYFPSIGYGMLDSTTCDIYLVNDCGELIGRPILTACIDAYTSMCLGYSIGWEGGISSLRKLMTNVVSSKVDWCKKFGIDISESDWNSHWIPHKLITDMGSEYVGDTFSQLVDLGVEFINLEPYRPELKSLVERFFGLVQDSFKKELINKGVVLKDFGDRGAIDYRRNACLTLDQFEAILLHCILHYNCKRIIDLPYEISGIKSNSASLWNHCLPMHKDMLIEADENAINLVLLSRCEGYFRRDGLVVNKLRYKAFGFTNDYLSGGKALVAYDPKNVSKVWLIRDGNYYEFSLIEKFFDGKDLEEVSLYKNKKVDVIEIKEEMEDAIKLSKCIEDISSLGVVNKKIKLTGLRKNRHKELNGK